MNKMGSPCLWGSSAARQKDLCKFFIDMFPLSKGFNFSLHPSLHSFHFTHSCIFPLPTHNPSRFISRLVQQRHSTRHQVVVFCTCAFNSRLLAPFYTEEHELTTFIRKNIFVASCQVDVQKRKWQIWKKGIDWNKWHNRVGHMWMS